MKQNQIIAIRNLLYKKRITISKLAKEINTNRVMVSMALNGRLQSPLIDGRIIEWYETNKNLKGE